MRLASHSHVDITQKSRPYLEALSEATGETVVLIGASRAEVLILHSVVSPNALRVAPVAGNFLSIYATAGGKVLLASMSEEIVLKMLGTELKPLTPKTPTLEQFLAQLGEVRRTGFAMDFDEHTLGVGAIAVGLQTPQGQYAIDVVGPVWRMEQSVEAIKAALLKCQRELSDAMRSIA
jgi:DNA-binding IclR family transcriptional regulator